MLYSFERLIDKYTVECQLKIKTNGHWSKGKYVEEEKTCTDIKGAIVPMTEKRINSSGGDYKQGDCQFYTTEKIDLSGDAYIIYKDKQYKIEEDTNYEDYADFYNYVARRVSKFDKPETD